MPRASAVLPQTLSVVSTWAPATVGTPAARAIAQTKPAASWAERFAKEVRDFTDFAFDGMVSSETRVYRLPASAIIACVRGPHPRPNGHKGA